MACVWSAKLRLTSARAAAVARRGKAEPRPSVGSCTRAHLGGHDGLVLLVDVLPASDGGSHRALMGGEHLDMLAELGLADLELRNACAPRRMSVWTLGDARWWQDCVVRPLTSGRSALASTWRNDVYALAH